MQDILERIERGHADRWPRVITGPNPAAGAEVSVVVPGGRIWIVEAITVTLVASADVANRNPVMTLTDGNTEWARIGLSVSQTAGLTVVHSWIRSIGYGSGTVAVGSVHYGLPSVPMFPGWRLATVTQNLQAADDFGAPVLLVTEIPYRGEAAELAERQADREEFAELVARSMQPVE